MTIIQGVGDEVFHFFIVVGAFLVGWIAWCSTNIADQPLIRTVLILQHRTRTRIAAFRANPPQQPSSTENSDETRQSESNSSEVEANCPEFSLSATSQVSNESTETPAATSEEVLIRTMDSFNNEESSLLQQDDKVEEVEKNSTETKNMIETETTVTKSPESEEIKTDESENNESKISIKLKFINDDQKLVSGSLKEMLGDFKKRHFQLELESRKLVRLVFNGQVLQPDTITLEQCGFFNNCVVHCLIHQPRPTPVASNSPLDSSSRLYFNPQSFQNLPSTGYSVQTEWDLSRLLVCAVTLMLGLAWYFRFHYAQLFTVTTTMGLAGLTAIFAVSLYGHLYPEQDSIRNIE